MPTMMDDPNKTASSKVERTRRMKDLPAPERPREKLTRFGPEHLTDAELLAIFFRTGLQGMNAIEMGAALIEAYGSLNALSRISAEELCLSQKGIGPAKAAELVAVFEMGKRLAKERLLDVRLDQPDLVYELFGLEMQGLQRETLRVVLLNARYRLIKVEEVSLGTSDQTVANPREVLRPSIIHHAHAFILLHNHPSGDSTPSEADRRLTRRVQEAAQTMELQMLDHMIIGRSNADWDPGWFSFRAEGIL